MNCIYSKHACLINFTGNEYHWGCYGTSIEIYKNLVEKNYYVELINVSDVHSLSPHPKTVSDYDSIEFFQSFFTQNPRLFKLLSITDIVVVNGEGTLHGAAPGPLNLLYLIYVAKVKYQKKVHLINCSIYPADQDVENPELDYLYKTILSNIDLLVIREDISAKVMKRLDVSFLKGFDCLPKFIHRHGLCGSAQRNHGILIAYGVTHFDITGATNLTTILKKFSSKTIPIYFLTGAKSNPAQEDQIHFQEFKKILPEIELINAKSPNEWLEAIGRSKCLISGRFHYSIAAAALGTPFLAFGSNTSKIQGMLSIFEAGDMIDLNNALDLKKIEMFIDASINGTSQPVSQQKVEEVIKLSENNFLHL